MLCDPLGCLHLSTRWCTPSTVIQVIKITYSSSGYSASSLLLLYFYWESLHSVTIAYPCMICSLANSIFLKKSLGLQLLLFSSIARLFTYKGLLNLRAVSGLSVPKLLSSLSPLPFSSHLFWKAVAGLLRQPLRLLVFSLFEDSFVILLYSLLQTSVHQFIQHSDCQI